MLSDAAQRFYRERNRRRDEYLGGTMLGAAPIHVTVGRDALRARAGQIAVLSLANLLARAHRRVAFRLVGGDVERQVPVPFGAARTVGGTIEAVMAAVDPWGEFVVATASAADDMVTLGVGADLDGCAGWYIGADRALGQVDLSPVPVMDAPGTVRGAGAAACLGAAAVFVHQLGQPVIPRRLSAWNWLDGDAAAIGPEDVEPIDVGEVLFVGAGAVGSGAAYWVGLLGTRNRWDVVDGDFAELHNTDRSLLFTAADAGWAGGHPNGKARAKARILAEWLPGAVSHECWYDECLEITERPFEVVLALANERNVRHWLAARHVPVALQATTGERFLAQIHRHVLGRDDCVACRTGQLQPPKLGCSTQGIKQVDGTSTDAALPFLSAASGLMLATALERLQRGELVDGPRNRFDWRLGSDARMTSAGAHRCRDGCPNVLSADLRVRIAGGRRWGHLVG